MTKDEMVAMRDRIIRGIPPYRVDDMGNLRRDGGTPGLQELKKVGDHNPDSAVIRLTLESCLQLVDHLLERMRG
jgi:hypothetical protein